MQEIIAAIATPLGVGGIGVIRMSGKGVFELADKFIRLTHGQVDALEGYRCAHGRIFDAEEAIDEVVVTVFRAPRSFTGEDTVEIAAHGGVYLLRRILEVCCKNGAQLAEPGEFSKWAFLNGKLDLTAAEAVVDLIAAENQQAAKAALTARDGALYRAAREVSGRLIAQAGHLAAWIDYPEEEIIEIDAAALAQELTECCGRLTELLATCEAGRLIREGIETAIVGRPNAGKSTLMNLLTGEESSIVAEIAGTTRDVVSDTVRLGDLLLRLADTAGIRETQDAVEQAGVRRARERLERAQLVLAVFDGSDELDENDRRVMQDCAGRTAIAIINKNDLEQRLPTEEIVAVFGAPVWLSAKEGRGAEQLRQRIEEIFALGLFDPAAAAIANDRQREAVAAAQRDTAEALAALTAGVSYDAVCVCMENAADALLRLTGEKAAQAVVDEVFARFCVGK